MQTRQRCTSTVVDYLTCPVCLETFKEPVTLGCNHSFCSSCLQSHWDQNNTRICPVCRRRSSKDVTIVNFALKQLCISFIEKQKSERRAGVCSSHPAVPSLFCLDEARAVCPVCESIRTYCSTQRGRSISVRLTSAEFTRLHRFLHEEEELRLKALREEQSRQAQTVYPELGRIRETLASVEQSILELQTQLDRTTTDFIHSYKPTQSPTPQLLPQPGPGLLLNQSKVLGNLAFNVWRKMGSTVLFSPVILDPNTAHPQLRLSENLISLSIEGSPVQLPDNPERFQKFPLVLGSEGFSSGTHQWDVEVGNHRTWIIGVARESVNRTNPLLYPEHGYWTLSFTFGFEIMTSKQQPQKIRVHLDYENGTVSFYDLTDMSLILTYKDIFTEKLFPCFSVGSSKADCQTKTIRICQNPAQVHV
uniref:Uncharacterized protein n=1 Tax=Neogobius melanostomus TaxID=47308 RepID=A0A8C6UJ28_9GOBI